MMVVVSAQAENDLSAIRYWIAEDNPERAGTFLDQLEQRFAGLDRWPLRYPVAFQSSEGPVRRLVHRGYRILHRVHHGSRDAPRFD